MKNYFQGKTIWLTGASSGIGEALAYALSQQGARLILSARRATELERVKKGCAHPEKVDIVPIDLSSSTSVEQAINHCLVHYERIDMLFNNGGISQRAEALETDIEVVRKMMEIDFFSNIALSKAVALRMKENGGGHIIITSSLMGKWGFFLRSGYAAAKHALHGYYDSMRMEVEQYHIQITLLTPGFIASDISKHALDNKGTATGEMDNNQATGMTTTRCAEEILRGVAAGKTEFGIGGKELLGLKLRRFVPALFEKILRKRSAR
ncbi:MAG: SDR family oxidoreductase [Flavobacteriales bacterium]